MINFLINCIVLFACYPLNALNIETAAEGIENIVVEPTPELIFRLVDTNEGADLNPTYLWQIKLVYDFNAVTRSERPICVKVTLIKRYDPQTICKSIDIRYYAHGFYTVPGGNTCGNGSGKLKTVSVPSPALNTDYTLAADADNRYYQTDMDNSYIYFAAEFTFSRGTRTWTCLSYFYHGSGPEVDYEDFCPKRVKYIPVPQ